MADSLWTAQNYLAMGPLSNSLAKDVFYEGESTSMHGRSGQTGDSFYFAFRLSVFRCGTNRSSPRPTSRRQIRMAPCQNVRSTIASAGLVNDAACISRMRIEQAADTDFLYKGCR
jgi:hypothetical protein